MHMNASIGSSCTAERKFIGFSSLTTSHCAPAVKHYLIPMYNCLRRIHCDLFPNKRIVQADVVVRLQCIIMHAYAGMVFIVLVHYHCDLEDIFQRR